MNFDLFKDITINGQAVVQLSLDGSVVWKKGGEEDETTQYFNIEALEDGTIEMQHFGTNADTTTPVFEYSTDNVVWNTWDYLPISVNTGDKVYFRGTNTHISSSTSNYSTFNPTCSFKANGNIMSLLYGDDFKGQVSLSGRNYCFCRLFSNSKIVKAPELPATTLANRCYSGMFYGCTSLTTAPALPATTLASSCYSGMFRNCTSLTTAPELPATTLADYCYSDMFNGCTSLTTAPELPATTLAKDCYGDMFNGCTSLTTAPELPATTLASSCYFDMFSNCTSLTTAPELPATTLAHDCYNYMFYNCTSLTTAPELPATTLASNCYFGMFSDCTSLTTAPELPATTLANGCYSDMFYGCTNLNSVKCMARYTNTGSLITSSIGNRWLSNVAPTGTFYKNPDWAGPTTRAGKTIPTGWTIVDWI